MNNRFGDNGQGWFLVLSLILQLSVQLLRVKKKIGGYGKENNKCEQHIVS